MRTSGTTSKALNVAPNASTLSGIPVKYRW
jgi:hypothetical protein